jgi:hypothetical protein
MTDATASLPPKLLPAQPHANNAPGLEDDSVRIAEEGQFWLTEDGPTFAEVLDILNPLHHIPGISSIYRAITGDEIGAGPRFVGGMLFGGPIGALAAGLTALFEEASGGDLGEHLAELVDDFTGGGDNDSPAIAADTAAKAAAVVTAAGGANGAQINQAALPVEHAAAAAYGFNRIALNPAAALGAPHAAAMGAAQHISQNIGQNTARNTADTAAVRLPKDAKIFPAHPPANAAPQGMAIPFGGNARTAGTAGQQQPQAAPQVSAAVARSRRQQADLMLAQWAAQQMAQQNGPAAAANKKAKSGEEDENSGAQKPAPHPMMPPRNASPEWYAQAMDKALNQYRSGANTLPAGVPALSVTR